MLIKYLRKLSFSIHRLYSIELSISVELLGIGDWGLGIGPNPQSPIPNPQSPIFSESIEHIKK
jgi:hypothetical protein